ncbi:MAG: CPBP family glutamic-type intramembrane protease [Candidatus Hodarchaeales archaeon]
MRISGKINHGWINVLSKHWIVILVIITLAFSSIMISASIAMKSLRPHSRYKDGVTVDGVTGELYLIFTEYSSNSVMLTVRSRIFIDNPEVSGQFINISINSLKTDIFDNDPQQSQIFYINDWNLKEESVDIIVIAYFTVNNEKAVKIHLRFLAGTDDSTIPEILSSSGFLLSSMVILFIILRIIFSNKKKEYEVFHYGLSRGIRNENTCQHCGTSLHPDISFCTNCGQLIRKECSNPECDWKLPIHANFCPGCGFPSSNNLLFPRPNESALFKRVSMLILKFSFFGFTGLLIINTVLLLPAYTTVLTNLTLMNSIPIFILLPFPFLLFTLENIPLLLYVLVIFIIIFLMLVTTIFIDLTDLLKKTQEKNQYLDKIGDNVHELNENGLILLFKLFSISFAIQITITLLITSAGIHLSDPISLPSNNEPDELIDLLPSWSSYPSQFISLIFGLINAALYEELIVRVLLIGVPLLAIGLVNSLREQKLEKEMIQQLFGYDLARNRPINRTEWILILTSSIIFGVAHLLSWDIWKVIPAAIVGCFLGYIFIKRGLILAVILHAAYDYLGFFLMLKIVDFNSLLDSNPQFLNFLLAATVPLFYLVLLCCFFISGYIYLIRIINDFTRKQLKS